MKKIILPALICFISSSAFALNLKQALTKSYKNNEEIELNQSNFLTEIEQFPEALSAFMPRVSIGGSLSEERGSSKPFQGSFSKTNTNKKRTRYLTVKQPVFSGWSSVSQLKAAQSTFRKSRSDYYSKEQEILLKTIEAYIDCIASREKHEISKVSVKANKVILESVEERLKLGDSTRTELANAKEGVASAESKQAVAYANYETSKAQFINIFGEQPINIKMPSPITDIPISVDVLIDKALNSNLQLESARHAIKITKATENASKGQLLPQVNFEFQANDTINSNASSVLGASGKKRDRSSSASLSVNIPILSRGGAEYSEIRKAKQKKRQTAISFHNAIKSIKAQCRSSFAAYTAAKRRIDATDQAVEAASIAYDGAVQEEILGSKSIIDVLSAEAKLNQAKASNVDAKKDLILASYKIKSLIGGLTAKGLKLPVKYFEPEREFKRVKTKIIGF